VSVQHLVWLPRVVVACVCVHPGGRSVPKSGAQLLFYPRYHLDNSSLLARYPLEQARKSIAAHFCFFPCLSTCTQYSTRCQHAPLRASHRTEDAGTLSIET